MLPNFNSIYWTINAKDLKKRYNCSFMERIIHVFHFEQKMLLLNICISALIYKSFIMYEENSTRDV